MKVVLLSRKPRQRQNFSIELIAAELLRHLSSEFAARLEISRFESNGLLRRFYNIVEAARRQGEINHVMGDVHFLTYMLAPERTLLTIHDCGSISGRNTWRKRLIRLLWFKIPARRCAAITVVSQEVKRDLLRHVDVDPAKIHIVPSLVPGLYRRLDRPFAAHCPVVLQVGTAPNKNLLRLCEALRGIRCKLIVTGVLSPQQRRKLAACEVDYENHVGISTEAMVSLYERASLVAFVSTFEGFGMPIVEAQLVGRPVVTSNVASMPEVAGEGACLVDPFDVQSIRAGIQRVIDDANYRQALVERGFMNARRFEAGVIAATYEDIYRRIAANQSLGSARRAAR